MPRCAIADMPRDGWTWAETPDSSNAGRIRGWRLQHPMLPDTVLETFHFGANLRILAREAPGTRVLDRHPLACQVEAPTAIQTQAAFWACLDALHSPFADALHRMGQRWLIQSGASGHQKICIKRKLGVQWTDLTASGGRHMFMHRPGATGLDPVITDVLTQAQHVLRPVRKHDWVSGLILEVEAPQSMHARIDLCAQLLLHAQTDAEMFHLSPDQMDLRGCSLAET